MDRLLQDLRFAFRVLWKDRSFAVTTVARGEGVGRDLWRALSAEFPRLFWRSRADNPITSWYREHCDGLQRLAVPTATGDTAPWVVFWRGLAPDELPAAIAHCATTPPDFLSYGPPP